MKGTGNITVWINSPGGDCVAAAQIYNMLMDYKGNVTVKIDGIAASAASVIAMAGTTVLMSPVSMLMIHNPMTIAMGDKAEMEKAIDMLSAVKDSIMNAYEIKTGLSRAKISHLMDEETWMDANKAVELGFADEILSRPTLATPPFPQKEEEEEDDETKKDDDKKEEGNEEKDDEKEQEEEKKKNMVSMLYSKRASENNLLEKLKNHIEPSKPEERKVSEILDRLNTIKKFI